ncbi:MAG: carboxypeptidase M32 [Candidatus Marinimicrobia bacterium]|jgi:carboxypeptidase Taq|nr:carboxypeptidase M32 [Candidatus Neomarinimicrobiota bacterium]MBT4714276.1 carboxypeptidase M32 [Candidatus Neomarinimicrobiota bacterium]MBT4946742.1 carboxypeptidase M32 [Candidatus Neomarinimicrobiota bacterium]MBT5269233.1 carboxypeptidase M32 [Candidatus Neomarinimicrobiota bacterium]MBT6010265.1 carboxypeptidase M32 [Candidatus Neomarinimicrobiota bacterium]
MEPREIILKELLDASHLQGIEALLGWDQETYMPEGAGAARSEQVAYITTLMHSKLVGNPLKTALEELIDPKTGELRIMTLSDRETRQLKEIWRDYRQESLLPTEFVTDLAKHASVSQQAWVRARKDNDFAFFEPFLTKMVQLQKEKANYLGGGATPYDSLLDQFEPEMTSEKVASLFTEIRARLVPLIQNIREVKHRVNGSVLTKEYDMDKQWDFGITMLEAIGFDSNIGRQDRSAHPFTTSTHPTDVRTTTRLRENDLKSALLSTLHEGGHALYEQGLPTEEYGNPLGQSISLGIHESQSRMWENLVGLSPSFWRYAYPKLQAKFPDQLRNTDRDMFFAAMNRVRPSLIRVEADEATYNLHIMLRFEIEKMIINENFPVAELPQLWNDKMEEYLGVRPSTDSEGVLQDVHWSFGAFGYFPTYTLGNLYSVQFYNQAKQDLPGLDESCARGDFSSLLGWLREHIHSVGRGRKAEELVQEVTGQALSAQPFMDYLESKYKAIYSID